MTTPSRPSSASGSQAADALSRIGQVYQTPSQTLDHTSQGGGGRANWISGFLDSLGLDDGLAFNDPDPENSGNPGRDVDANPSGTNPQPAGPAYQSYIVLELGNPNDAIALISGFHGRANALTNLTPDDRNFANNLDFQPGFLQQPAGTWFPGFDAAPAPEAWLNQWAAKTPDVVYLSGHFTGSLWNEGSGDNYFEVGFGTRAQLSLERGSGNSSTLATTVHQQCKLVIIVGCSVVGSATYRNRIQTFFTDSQETRPIVLGFSGICPSVGQDQLVELFVSNLPDSANWTDQQIQQAWIDAAEAWTGDGNVVGYVDRQGNAFRNENGTAVGI